MPSPSSSARTSDSRNRRCPPGVRILPIRPAAAHRVTVFGSTRNSAATSPGVSRRAPVSTMPPRVNRTYRPLNRLYGGVRRKTRNPSYLEDRPVGLRNPVWAVHGTCMIERVAVLSDIHGVLPALEVALLSTVDDEVTTIVCGHTHMPFVRLVDRRLVVNPGSVGMPYGSAGGHWALLGPGTGVQLRPTLSDADAGRARARAAPARPDPARGAARDR